MNGHDDKLNGFYHKQVMAKRTNQPGLSTTNRFPRGFRGRTARGAARGSCCHGSAFRGTRRPM